MPRNKNIYSADRAIEELKRFYYNDLMRTLIEKERFDLILSYAIFQKGAKIGARNNIKFEKQVYLRGEEIRNIQYEDRETKMLEAIYDEKIKGLDIEPNLKWREEIVKFVSPQYLEKLKDEQNKVLQSFDWDIIAFAQHVPFADKTLLEDRIIQTGNALKILAFAKDVDGAHIDKLRCAIEKTSDKDAINHFYIQFGSKSESERQ